MSPVCSTAYSPRAALTLSLSPELAAPPPQAKRQPDEASCLCCSSSCSLLWWLVLSTMPTRTWMQIKSTPSKASGTASSSPFRALWTTQPPTWVSAAVLQRAPASKDPQQSLAIPTPLPCRLPQHTTTQAVNLPHLFFLPTWLDKGHRFNWNDELSPLRTPAFLPPQEETVASG